MFAPYSEASCSRRAIGRVARRLPAYNGPARAGLARAACFGALLPFEVTLEGCKVVGLAQVRRRTGTLFQAALLLRWAPARLSELLAVPPGRRAALTAALAARAMGLQDYSAPPV